jgi:hypothetical protein
MLAENQCYIRVMGIFGLIPKELENDVLKKYTYLYVNKHRFSIEAQH